LRQPLLSSITTDLGTTIPDCRRFTSRARPHSSPLRQMGSTASSAVGGGRHCLQGSGKKSRAKKNRREPSPPQTCVARQWEPPSGREAERRQINGATSTTRRKQRRRDKAQREQGAFRPPSGENRRCRQHRAAGPSA